LGLSEGLIPTERQREAIGFWVVKFLVHILVVDTEEILQELGV
jgi:hypothetical protein